MSRSLVTGGAGFLGSHVVARLVDGGDRVRVLDPARPHEPVPGAEYRSGSVTDRTAVRDSLAGVDRVFHLAGPADLWVADEAHAREVHEVGTRTVLEEAGRAGVGRIVHTSTEAILRDFSGAGFLPRVRPRGPSSGEADTGHPSEGGPGSAPTLPDPGRVPRGYCRSKLLAEREALDAARAGLPVVVVSPSAPFGPGDRNLGPPSRMLLGFLNGRLPAYLDGWLSVVDVRDLAAGQVAAAERGEPGRRYVLAAEDLRLGRLLRKLEALTGRSMPRVRIPAILALATAAVSELVADHLTREPPDATVAGVRIAMAPPRTAALPGLTELGVPPRSLDGTLRATVEWFRDRGLLEDR